ncbi:MAG: dihydrodipicolinate synthase family protein [Bacteroidales bacterium]|nr:dihydrodipicolinate synthase family protein [Bacteroidales bacterium]
MGKDEKKYSGVIVPMITPFNADFSIDKKAVAFIMKTFTKSKCSAFILGTTGESTSIPDRDKAFMVETAVEQANRLINVYAGISGNCLRESIDNANLYASMGADAVVAHLPFYYPVKAENMVRYFSTLADHIKCPLILYNNPITVKDSIPLDVIEKLSHHTNIGGIKDSERGTERMEASLERWSSRSDFSFLLGWSAQSAYALSKGCDGIVPSTANLTPQLYQDLYREAIAGNSGKAAQLQKLTDNITDLYIKDRSISESIPALKIIMHEFGLCKTFVLPPMYETGPADQLQLRKMIRNIWKEESVIIG